MNDVERQGRRDMAAAFRWTARLGMHESIANHFSFAVSDTGKDFLINPWGKHFSEICASDLLLVDDRGQVLKGDGVVERSAICIHAHVHRKLPHARCVMHVHSPYASALGAIENGRLEPVHQSCARFYGQIAYDDKFRGLAFEEDEGQRICNSFGNKQILIMAQHGVTVLGNTVAEAFDRLYYLERACEIQIRAMSTGRPLKVMSDEVAQKTARDWNELTPKETRLEEHHFVALRRILEREEPEYVQ